ncbi:MAG: iron-sulfur cluster assembly scaffold protein [Planctomycetota bacterium]|nr:iron-sulfur cluster assembly scaffold protein [Planctomycetota bacterium]
MKRFKITPPSRLGAVIYAFAPDWGGDWQEQLNSYSEILTDHFSRPRNVGELAGADGVGTAGAAECGDTMTIWIRVRDEVVTEVTFKCLGCPAAIACGSMTTQLAGGRHLEKVDEITNEAVAEALGGLPGDKRHCSNLGAEALQNAVMDYILRSAQRQYALKQSAG